MAGVEKISDLLEVAIRIERAGVEFYKTLSDNAQSSGAKDTFSFLAAEEEKHIGTFRSILEKVADYAPRLNYPGEYELFLQGIAGRSIGTLQKAKDENILAGRNISAAVDVALDMETESILFYSGMLENFRESERRYINEVIAEEKAHFVKLLTTRDKIKF
ncbi:MAG: ferritin-like domain-containing protein [Candidatus Omnitrophota bacterium]